MAWRQQFGSDPEPDPIGPCTRSATRRLNISAAIHSLGLNRRPEEMPPTSAGKVTVEDGLALPVTRGFTANQVARLRRMAKDMDEIAVLVRKALAAEDLSAFANC